MAASLELLATVALLWSSAVLLGIRGEHAIGSYGKTCSSSCSQRDGTTYTWCVVDRNRLGGDYGVPVALPTWDYCSPTAGYDYQGKRCASRCGSHGYSYRWCYLLDGSWGYCSL